MLKFIIKRLLFLLLTILTVSLLVFLFLEFNVENVAAKVLGQFSTQEQRALWLEENGYYRPWFTRYAEWCGNFFTGDLGYSNRYKTDVAPLLFDRLKNTAVLGGLTLLFMTPISMLFGILAGMRENKRTDRIISLVSIITSSLPEFATAVIFSAIFVFYLEWLPGVSTMNEGWNVVEMILPVSVLTIYGFGYLTRITRASMIEVMKMPYIRTAVLKGLPFPVVITKHAIKNALITPITVLFLQLPWLLSGVIVVEFTFSYRGFGALLLEASLNDDLYLIEACAIISVFVVVFSQVISDISYMLLNPKIRL